MIGFRIIDKKDFTYTLRSEDDKIESLIFEFYGGITPEIDNILCFNEKLLDRRSESFCQPYAFLLTQQDEYIDDGEYLALRQNGQNYILKRVYG